jgi:hypothetical protein
MSITGTGTQADPYVVTTYAELVEKAAESGVYIKVGNDINITSEYPEGNMPTLTVNSPIDGNNKKISNWYKITSGYCVDAKNTVSNLTFGNINIASNCDGFYHATEQTDPHFENCKFYGILYKHFKVGDKTELKSCSMNLSLKFPADNGTVTLADFNGIFFNNCYLKADDTTATASRSFFPNFNYRPFAKDSYFEINTTASSIAQYSDGQGAENSVFDIQTNANWTWGDASGYSCSIFNKTSAPNVSGSNNVIAVTDEHWLDTAYLASIGFNAG